MAAPQLPNDTSLDPSAGDTCGTWKLQMHNTCDAKAFVVGGGIYRQVGGQASAMFVPVILRPGQKHTFNIPGLTTTTTVPDTTINASPEEYFPYDPATVTAGRVALWYVQLNNASALSQAQLAEEKSTMAAYLRGSVFWDTLQYLTLGENLCSSAGTEILSGDGAETTFHNRGFTTTLYTATNLPGTLDGESADPSASLFFADVATGNAVVPVPSRQCQDEKYHIMQVMLSICAGLLALSAIIFMIHLFHRHKFRRYTSPRTAENIDAETAQKQHDLRFDLGFGPEGMRPRRVNGLGGVGNSPLL